MRDGVLAGRYCILNKEFKNQLFEEVKNSSVYAMTEARYYQIAIRFARQYCRQRGIPANGFKSISKDTLRRWDEELGITTKNAEQTTDARAKAVADHRHAASFIAAQLSMQGLVPPALIINVDATSYTVGKDTTKKSKVKIATSKIKVLKRDCVKTLPEDNLNSGTGLYTLKYYLLISADGTAGPPVYVVAHRGMKEGEYKAYPIEGLGYSVGLEDIGYIVLCRDRSMNVAFYKWFIETLLIQFVEKQKRRNTLPVETLTFFQLDGEAKQIECFKDPLCLEVCNANSIVVGKPPASTTATTQPCDAGNCFKASKGALKKITDEDVKHKTGMLGLIRQQLKAHNSTYSATQKLSAAHLTMAAYGCLRVQQALINTVKSNVITDSFNKAGVWDYHLKPPGPNIDTIIANCKPLFGGVMSEEDELHIRTAMPNLVTLMRTQGELFESDFDANNVRKNIDTKHDKDSLVMSRRRMVFLTNPRVIAREMTRKLDAEAKKNAIVPRKRKLPAVGLPVVMVNVAPPIATPKPLQIRDARAAKKARRAEVSADHPTRQKKRYMCFGCYEMSNDDDEGEEWLECECCVPGQWVCGNCHDIMTAHERNNKK